MTEQILRVLLCVSNGLQECKTDILYKKPHESKRQYKFYRSIDMACDKLYFYLQQFYLITCNSC